jgi:hypothetical protein
MQQQQQLSIRQEIISRRVVSLCLKPEGALTAAAPSVHTCTAESRCSVHAVVMFTNADGSAINGTSNTLMDYIRDGKI